MQILQAVGNSFDNQARLSRAGELFLMVNCLLLKDKDYTISIATLNPRYDRAYADAVKVQGRIDTGEKFGSPMAAVALTVGSRSPDVMGVLNGARALMAVVSRFDTLRVTQSIPFTNSPNDLIITFETNTDVSAGSSLTVEGLIGVAQQSGDVLLVQSNTSKTGSLSITTQGLLQTAAGLVVRINVLAVLTAHQIVEVRIRVTNGAGEIRAADAAVLRIGVQLGGMQTIAPSAADRQHLPLLGVPNGLMPLVMSMARFKSARVSQSCPLVWKTILKCQQDLFLACSFSDHFLLLDAVLVV
jgi:hypothetical protein